MPTGAGLASYLRLAPAAGTTEIGHLLFTPRLQRTHAASEAVKRLPAYALDRLGCRRVEWKCNALNARSGRVAERFGSRYEGEFRQATVARGRKRATAWYAMLDSERLRRRAGFAPLLAPENVDAVEWQRRPLTDFR